jgi:hypothetical protein
MVSISVFLPPEQSLKSHPGSWKSDWRDFGDAKGLTYLLWFALRQNGIPCELVRRFPESGIVISHAHFFERIAAPNPDLYLISLQLDWPRSVYVHAHLVANCFQMRATALTLPDRLAFPGPRYFLRHMPQIGLIPRDPDRGERFERIAYFGLEKNLSPSLRQPQWAAKLKSLGLEWYPATDPSQWADYSQCDAIIALREDNRVVTSKPAQKLYNAWLAGLIPLMGPELGFREEGREGENYLEVANAEEALAQIDRLKSDPGLRKLLRENGRARTTKLSPEEIAGYWAAEFHRVILPTAERWLDQPLFVRKMFLAARLLRSVLRDAKRGSRGK